MNEMDTPAGMTLRDFFAAQALCALIQADVVVDPTGEMEEGAATAQVNGWNAETPVQDGLSKKAKHLTHAELFAGSAYDIAAPTCKKINSIASR